jgi:hypothetical protein
MIIHVFADPSHAWGKVKKSMLERLGVDREISPYSYQRGEFAYLEEDRDLGVFIAALENAKISYKFKEHRTDKDSHVRDMDMFKPESRQ